MSDTRTSKGHGSAGLHTLLGVALVGALLACTSIFSGPRQGWNPTYGPVVAHDSFPADCSMCHEGKTWTSIKADFAFDHEKMTGVALQGAHTKVACLLCHNDRGPAGTFAARGCAGCHEDPHRGQLGHACVDCHNESTWTPTEAIARHNRTRFPLIGAHAGTGCFRCHPGAQVGNYSGADSDCLTCHAADLARAKTPDHAAQGWVNDCQRCHTPTDWHLARFAHPSAFPLTGGHAGHSCSACHTGGVYTGLSTACDSCHMPQYNATTNPNHAASGFSTTCNQCHNTNSWQGATFNHSAGFPLTGGHAGLSCTQCHTGGVYTGLSTDCASCHLSQFNATTNPNHSSAGFPTTCAACHTTTSWQGATFNHTQFPITSGPHAVSCVQCHTTPSNYAVFSCTGCHTQTTTNNHHSGVSGYQWVSSACYQCHPQGRN